MVAMVAPRVASGLQWLHLGLQPDATTYKSYAPNHTYINKKWGCNCRCVSLRQPQPFIIHHSLLLVFDQFLSIAISSEIDTSVVFSVPSEYVTTV